MFAHTSLAFVPLFVGTITLISFIKNRLIKYFTLVFDEQGRKKTRAINMTRIIATFAWITVAVLAAIYHRLMYCYIPLPIVGLSVLIDVVLICLLAIPGRKEMFDLMPSFDDGIWGVEIIPAAIWFIAILIFIMHLFFTMACICQWDWVFRPIIGQSSMDYIAEQREIDSINRADREEQDFWNVVFITEEVD